MTLIGMPLLALSVALALACPLLAVLLWDRLPGSRLARAGQRLGLVLLAQLAAVLMTGVLVNDQYDLYSSWSDLFGQNPMSNGPQPVSVTGASGDAGHAPSHPEQLSGGSAQSSGRLINEQVIGPRSRIRSQLWILFPPGYDDPANQNRRYPVIEFLSGYPGTPATWLHAMQLQQISDGGVRSGRVRPFIAVLPVMNVAMPKDTECTDIPGGLQVATWLGWDVPRIVAQQARTADFGTGWGVTGYSTGGFCTAKLVLRFPETFGAGAALSGYFSPLVRPREADLFGGDPELRNANDPVWLVRHGPPAARLLVVFSVRDQETAEPSRIFLAAVRAPLQVDVLKLPAGGHNAGVWRAVEPQVLAWLSGELQAPALPRVPRQVLAS